MLNTGLKDLNTQNYISFDIRNDEMFTDKQIDDIKEILSDEKNTIITYSGMGYDNHVLGYSLSRPTSTSIMLNDYSKLMIREGIKGLDKDNRDNKIAVATIPIFLLCSIKKCQIL